MRARVARALARPAVRGAAVGLACGLLGWAVAAQPAARGLEEWFQDAAFVDRGARVTATRLVVVGLDDASLRDLPKPMAFASPELAEVVEFLDRQGAAAVGIDVLVPEDLDTFPGLEGERLGLVAARSGKVVLPAVVDGDGRLVPPLTSWRAGAPLGLVRVEGDADRFVRRQAVLAAAVEGQVFDPFPVALLAAAGRAAADPQGRLRVDGRVVPLDDRGSVRINFVGPPGAVPHVPFRAALSAARGGPSLAVPLRGAVVIVGATAGALGDYHATPYANRTWLSLWGRPAGLMSGPELHANAVATLADGAFITTPIWAGPLPLALATGAALGAALASLSLVRGAALALAHHFGWKVVCLLAFWAAGVRVEVVAVLAAGALCFALSFAFRWRWLRRSFGAFKGEAIARALEADPGQRLRLGQEQELTVLFADVRGFTTFSESHAPREVVALLNAYFDAVVPVLERHGGALNQYMGDGVMVLFGAPEPRPDHAARAVRAAVDLVRRVRELAPLWERLGYPGMRVGVGINTGPAVVGAVGSRDRLDYTAIGDTTNTAARVEAANKEVGSEVLVTGATRAALPPGEAERLGVGDRPVSLRVKNKDVTVYRVDVVGAGR
jgi:class 3 adenylate cyclase/CHASE2 domain-containing sensor protein